MKSFWEDLPKPFTVLAPMDGVTDIVFRNIVAQIGRPNVFFTEFINVEGLNSNGRERVSEGLRFDLSQKPIVAQLWGKDPEDYLKSAKYCKDFGFDGIDINMGCPDRTIVRNGSCSALIKNPKLAKSIIEATKKGAEGLPISVKTRIGFSKIELDWIEFLLNQDLAALTLHLRTVSEMSKVPAHWEEMTKIIELRDKIAPQTLIIGNGDIESLTEVDKKFAKFGCEGFMIGRGIFNNPWLFNSSIDIEKVTTRERLDLFIKHINLFDKTWGENKNPSDLKKFCKTYVNNFDGAVLLREKIMLCSKTQEMLEVLDLYSTF